MILEDGTRARLLVIEQSAEVRQLYLDVFSMSGCDVAVCSTYENAIGYASSFKPHVLFVSVAFTDDEGKEASKLLQDMSLPKSTVHVAISGYANWKLEMKLLASGFHFYFLKPVSFSNLFSPIRTIPGFSDPDGLLPMG